MCQNYNVQHVAKLVFSTTMPKFIIYLKFNETVEFAYSLDADVAAHNEPPHLNLLCLPSGR